tara:strand:- start:547 stop:942 length:396 start_codon:yes stop_codon:yes gene_type:complete
VLGFHFFFISLEQKGASSKLFRLESLDIEHIELLYLVDEVFKNTVRCGFQSLTELELLVINKADRSRVLFQLGHRLHEVNSHLVVGENNRIEDTHLRKGLNSHDDISDDTDVTFTSHHNVVEVHAVGGTRP